MMVVAMLRLIIHHQLVQTCWPGSK